jgi:alginate O-acetyltransferase complex protein AlgI
MALCGLWHGAAWTFVIWGLWHGLLLALNQSVLARWWRDPAGNRGRFNWLQRLILICTTFVLVHVGWLLFRASSLKQAGLMLSSLLTLQGGLRPSILRENNVLLVAVIFGGLVLAQWMRGSVVRMWRPVSAPDLARNLTRAFCYTVIILAVIVFDREAQPFVYFQF